MTLGPSFTSLFQGASPILPAFPMFLSLGLSSNIVLEWPTELNSQNGDIVPEILEINATAPNLAIQFPDATLVSGGYSILVNNIGAQTFAVLNSVGATIATVASGEVWQLYLADNTTPAGVWRVFQFGAGVSNANAAALAGAGLKAITTTLNERILVTGKNASYVIVNGDRATCLEWTGGSGGIFTLPDPGVTGADWFCYIKNDGTGTLTVNPTAGTIDGQATLAVGPNSSAIFATDGANFITIGFGQQLNSIFSFIVINLAGDVGNVPLTGPQLNRISYKFTGALAGNTTVIVPGTIQQYWVDNETSGGSLSFGTGVGTTVTVAPGQRNILYCDGTNVVAAVTLGSTGFGPGTVGAPSIFWNDNVTTGLYEPAANEIGFAISGVQAGFIDSAGTWHIDGPATNVSSLLINNNTNAAAITAEILSGFGSAAASPLLALKTSAAGGFATLSITGNNGTPGTTDFSLFQNGGDETANLLNRSNAAMNFGTANVIDMTLEAGGGLSILTPGGAIPTLQLGSSSTTTLLIAQAAGQYAALMQAAAGASAKLGLQDGQAGVRVWQARVGGLGIGVFDLFDATRALTTLSIDTLGQVVIHAPDNTAVNAALQVTQGNDATATGIAIVPGSGGTAPLAFGVGLAAPGSNLLEISSQFGATGAATPTLTANKPGANAGVIQWIPVLFNLGQGYIPIFGP